MPQRDWVFHEEEAVPPAWVLGLVWGAVAVAMVRGGVLGGGWVLVLGAAFHLFFGRLRVVVSRTSLTLAFGYTRLIQKLVTFDEIEDVEAVRYSPLLEFGGWGIRWGAGKRAWTIRGDGAVVLTLADGERLYVGADDPERLAERIRTAMARADGGGDVDDPSTHGGVDP